MSRQIGPTIEILLRRIRQEGGLALSPDLATHIYSLCEQTINAAFRRILVTTTLPTPQKKLLFNLREAFPDAIEIITFIESNRELTKVTSLDDFAAYDSTWFRSIAGTRFESWCQLSRDYFILYPGQAAVSSVEITYVKLLTAYTNFAASYNTNSELPDEDVELALALSELILLTRFRLLANVPKRLEQAQALINLRGVKT